MADLEKVLSRLPGAKKEGSEWKARCPCHDDSTPSLYVRNEGRKILVICRAGCPTDDVLKRLGLEWADLEEEDGKARQIVAEYDYRDADGTLLYQAVRLFPKDFRLRQPDGRGGWTWSLAGVPRVLYRLPEVLAAVAAGVRVYLVEGEKDADNLAAIGLVSTTNAGGAKKWDRGFTSDLRASHVVILPDNDAAGEDHAAHVASQLNGISASTRVVRLPDLPAKGDVSDWLKRGGNREELESLADSAPLWQPSKDPVSETYIQNFEIEKIEKIGREDAIYHVHVFECIVKMNVDSLNSFPLFTKAVMEIADRRPDLRNPKDWGPYLDMCMRERMLKIESPEDATREGVLWHHVCRYMRKGDEDESILAEKRGPWKNERYLYFHGPSLHHYLQVAGVKVEQTDLWDLLRRRGAINKLKKARDSQKKEHVIRAWLIEKASVSDETEDCSDGE